MPAVSPFTIILSGLFIGLATSAPVGGANILCINRAVHRGFWSALSVGVGAMVADMLLAGIFAFGLSAVLDLIQDNRLTITIVGSVMLIVFGLKIFLSQPVDLQMSASKSEDSTLDVRREKTNFKDKFSAGQTTSLIKEFGLAFLMTMTNPGAILAFTGIIAGTSNLIDHGNRHANATILVLGIGLGALIWWLTISGAASASRRWLTQSWLSRIHKTSGLLLMLFGMGLLGQLALQYAGIALPKLAHTQLSLMQMP